jgi:hypothetical protein
MAKKPKVSVFKVEGSDIQDFLKMLEKEGPEDLGDAFAQMMEQVGAGEKPEPCANPLCPSCMHMHGLDAEAIAMKVMDVFRLLDSEQRLKALTVIYGLLAKSYEQFPAPYDMHLGQGLSQFMGYFRNQNEKFAFATESGKPEEGAKH